jgi:hypothetical protein
VSKSTYIRNVVLGDTGVDITTTVLSNTCVRSTLIYISSIKEKKSILVIVRIAIRNESCSIYVLS